ncbi:MAG: response regulator [Hyphomicrobiales bacterium]|nr:response regulator [Hyphomicrobiales bacterium]
MAMPVRVLLIEDEPLISMLYEDVLEATEFKVIAVLLCNEDALEWLKENRPDVAIVDHTLSDGICLPVIRALKAARIPFLVSSGYSTFEEDELVDAVPLPKPFHDEHLIKMLREIVSQPA